MSSFARYVLKHKKEDTPEGDVARDLAQAIKEYGCCKASWSYKTLHKHITEDHRACERMITTLESMGEAYKKVKSAK
jgi:hypothetical protein